ncbi:ubiquitin-protein ligase E3B-like [Acanthaster planci]|uniref:Ubiquitin-protein ligase E3B n=1 Tax=Acanthaster planci TaxID=133434 RepID=A0A8B7ZG87_ACAPL|nr:ubiquitin-protein ligase E3B-like [Acanthaster planci]
MFCKTEASKKTELLEKAKASRNERAQHKQREQASVKIQAVVRGFLCRRRYRRWMLESLDSILEASCVSSSASPSSPQPVQSQTATKQQFRSAQDVFPAVRKFLMVYVDDLDRQRFEKLCRYILAGMDKGDPKVWYVSLALSKDHVLPWIRQLKSILDLCCTKLRRLKPESPVDAKIITLYLHMLVTFTDTTTWKILKVQGAEALRPSLNQLCSNVMGYLNSHGLFPMLQQLLVEGVARKKPCLSNTMLSALFTIALRPVIASKYSDNLASLFHLYVLSVPAMVLHLASTAPKCIESIKKHNLFKQSLDFLAKEQNTKIIFNVLEGNYALCLLANLVHLGQLEQQVLSSNVQTFTRVTVSLLTHCQSYVGKKMSLTTQWHPVLGWFSQPTDHRLHEAMVYVVKQLNMLWDQQILQLVFLDILKAAPEPDSSAKSPTSSAKTQSKGGSFLKRLQRTTSKLGTQKGGKSLQSAEVIAVCNVCDMYQTAIATLIELRRDILTGLSYRDLLLPRLWHFIAELGPHGGLKLFQECLCSVDSHNILSVLVLFCDVASYLIPILDDIEFYDQQIPFHQDDLVAVTAFLNAFVFKMIWEHGVGGTVKQASLFNSTHSLLHLLYDRDCRRQFAPSNHWLIKDLKLTTFRAELEKGSKRTTLILQKMPHVIPHRERVMLFRKRVAEEKKALGFTETASHSPHSTLITVHRTRLVEDGYQLLAGLPAQTLKGLIRVRFVNMQGLDEAGIDQDGVFKEFLEEIIKTVFNPTLNLFKTTSDQHLYPSPTSYINENHLGLFEFVGKMLAKAVYEGIVVEVPFASFFLSQMLEQQHNQLYSPIDELPSMDAELYKNLTYVKHYEGDISDLDLVFSYDEDVMGKIHTHELVAGGKAVAVTNENKISYIHLMAHHRLYRQILDQTKAFKRGFRSIINPEWLSWFSGPELQRLISGDNAEIDLSDLRKHTQYYGGFHNSHRVINWLFDVLANEFTAQERAQFLKFVTSCSKPPLLGFAHLEPPFSIRCVEVSDDQDTGDTVGSVLRGFLRIQKRDPVGRLPTSSTCFNLLKLPNYQKKATLKEKLRYAITSNTGFELS